MDRDRTRWDERYRGVALADPRPPDALVAAGEDAAAPDRGRVLDVACGLGPVARWAAGRGLDVVALDVSEVAVSTLRTAPETHRIDARRVDLDDGLPEGLGTFDLVVCQRFRGVDLLRTLPGAVAPGGLLVVTVLSEVGAGAPGPFHAPAGELQDVLDEPCRGWRTIHRSEGDGEASVVLRRPGRGAEA